MSRVSIHGRRLVDAEGHAASEALAFCPRKKQCVDVSVCQRCARFEGFEGEGGDAFQCRHEAVTEPSRARGVATPDDQALRVHVGEVMSPTTTCIAPDMPVKRVRDLLARESASHLPVVDREGVLLGMIGARELLGTGGDERADACMTKTAIGIPDVAPLAHAIATMAQARVMALPVLADDGSVVGCIDAVEAMRFFAGRWGYDLFDQ